MFFMSCFFVQLRIAGGGGNTVKMQVAKGPPTECRRVAPGPLLVGVARKHVKILGFWAAEIFICPQQNADWG
jgi:hypothetical protein